MSEVKNLPASVRQRLLNKSYLRGYPPESVVAEKLQALVFLGAVNM